MMSERFLWRRTSRALVVGLSLLCFTAGTADADAATKYDLRYKCSTGDVLRFSVDHQATIRSTIDEVTESAQTNTTSIKLWKVIDVLPNGEVEFMTIVERVKMVNQLPEKSPVRYDSSTDESAPPGFEDVAAAIGVPLSVIRLSPRGEILSREVKHHQPAADEDAPISVRLPDNPVEVGETWDEPHELTVKLKNGGTKVIQTRRHYKLAKVTHGIATIQITYQILAPVDSFIESQLLQRLMDGTVSFDIEAGRIVRQEMEIDKRILGFAGPTSSMHYVMRMEEELLADSPEVASKP